MPSRYPRRPGRAGTAAVTAATGGDDGAGRAEMVRRLTDAGQARKGASPERVEYAAEEAHARRVVGTHEE